MTFRVLKVATQSLVEDCARRALELGGRIVVAPHDVPDVGRICAVSDSMGAVAHLMQPIAAPAAT